MTDRIDPGGELPVSAGPEPAAGPDPTGPAADPDPTGGGGGATLSRRTVLQAAGAATAGGVGVLAGWTLRGVLDATTGAPGEARAPSVTPAPATGEPAATDAPAATGREAGGEAPPADLLHAFRSAGDLRPPIMVRQQPASGTAEGLLMMTPDNGHGPVQLVIYDESGEPVWVRPGDGRYATDLHVVTWAGRPALAWWEGNATIGVGDGEHVIADETYTEIARLAADAHADLHELRLTADGTAIFVSYEEVAAPATDDTSASAGDASAPPRTLYDCVVREVEIATGAARFEWHSAAHIGLDETSAPVPDDPDTPHDPVHVNSVDVDADGHLLISARNTSCIYKVDRRTGDVLWRMGGTRSDFEIGPGADFALQHDARRQADGTITIFDNRRPPEAARGIVLAVDEAARTVRLVRALERPEPLQAASQGSLQVLPDGHVLVGWGSQAVMTEFAPDGSVRFDASLPAGVQSYRNRRFPWTGRPTTRPALAVDPIRDASGSQRRVTAYATWNGATEVAAWALEVTGPGDATERVATLPRIGFETVLTGVTALETVLGVQAVALGADGGELGRSDPVEPD